jgi:tetratricopeptide (TPR) repeat protein
MKRRAIMFLLLGLLASPCALLMWGQELELGEPTRSDPAQREEAAILVDETDPGEVFVKAGTAFEAGDHARAIALYRALLDQGVENGTIHYNLGNAYLRNGELGRAIAAYRRSESFQPRDEDLRANLAFARKMAKDAIRPPGPSAIVETLFFWHYQLSRSELLWTVLAANLLLWSVLLLLQFRRASEALRWIFFSLLLLLTASGVSLAIHTLFPMRVAVVVPQETDAVTSPGDGAVTRFKLHAGSEVRVRDQREEWLRIALPDGQQGWIHRQHVELVET